MTQAAIVGKSFELKLEGYTILQPSDFEIPQKQITVIKGASGSGKTTLLRALNRLNDEVCQTQISGSLSIQLANQIIHPYQLPWHQLEFLRRKVGMLFQHPNLLPGSIGHNLLLPLKLNFPKEKSTWQNTMIDALQQAALWEEVKDRLNLPANQLSGGQQQRLCLARALSLRPEILLLDEPTASLDPHAVSQIEHQLQIIKRHTTIVMVSHHSDQIKRLADHSLHIQSKKMIS